MSHLNIFEHRSLLPEKKLLVFAILSNQIFIINTRRITPKHVTILDYFVERDSAVSGY